MSSSGKDFGRRNVFVGNEDTEKKKATTTTTTKDALERALSRHEKYVSSSEGRFAEDLGMPSELELQTQALSFSVSLLYNELTLNLFSL